MSAADPIAVVEAAYRFELDERAWLQSLACSMQPMLDQGLGTLVLAFQSEESGDVTLRHWAHSEMGTEAIGAGHSPQRDGLPGAHDPGRVGAAIPLRVPKHLRAGLLAQSHAMTTARSLFGERFDDIWVDELSRAGIQDFVGAMCFDPGRGVALHFGAPLSAPGSPDHVSGGLWKKLAVHVVAGYRLRAAMDAEGTNGRTILDAAEAVLDLNGHPVHADGAAKGRLERDALRLGVKAIDQARSKLRRQAPSEAVDLWRGLVSGRWSLVDHFDTDGRRFVIAQRNDPDVRQARPLSRRERQVVTFAVMGHSNKLIAYELGLAVSTVGRHLSRAMQKLGVASRAELIRVASLTAGDGPADPEP